MSESAISLEYGSSSEGSLELSTDGTKLVIAGYGVNAANYNSAESAYQPTNTSVAQSKSQAAGGPYGSGSLAQTYSVPNGGVNGAPAGDTVTPRVIADISANGTIDTSTSLLNVDNENNPRSVATANGTSFYLSGQGKKGDTTQGVFLATDGENDGQNGTTSTPIYNGVDTRTAELYGGNLYVSEDSSINPGTGGIYSYGPSPTGKTTPTILPGMTGSVALAAGQGNNVNGSSGTVDMSPENYFFANSTTLYIADSGNPKGGTLGDGGLQKWSFSNGNWSLDYTLSSGLNLVPNTTTLATDTGYGTDASTGLIGLTGQVNANGTVSLYATNATVGDLNNTYVYGITDTLADTTPTQAAGESFTQLFQAPADTNVRGIAFAPVCFASGTPIRTVRGHEIVDVAVEDLVIGDIVVTASGAHRPVKWLGHRTVDCNRHPAPREVKPIRVAAHTFAPNRPARDLYLSPGHSVCVDLFGEVLIPVARLANGATIAQVDVPRVTYWHVELESHDILLAGNLPCESYIDCGTRAFFAEADAVSLHASPDAPVLTTDDYCRPFHPEGPLVDFTRERLCRRANDLGWRLETTDPLGGLHLEVDGRRVVPQCDGLVARVTLPVPVRQIWLCSDSAVPADIHGAVDERQLGLQFGTAVADDGLHWRCEIGCGDDRLWEGFHPHEGSLRWTDGRARLPAELWRGARDMFVLRLAFAGAALPRWIAPAEVASASEAAAA